MKEKQIFDKSVKKVFEFVVKNERIKSMIIRSVQIYSKLVSRIDDNQQKNCSKNLIPK